MKKVHPQKILWSVRAIMYKLFFKELKLPSYIGKPIFIEGTKRIKIGKRVRIFPGIRMEALKSGFLIFEDNVYIGQNCHFTSEDSSLIIGEGSAIMANVCVTNIDHDYDSINTAVLEQGITTRRTVIGKNCFIGHGAVVQAGVELGDHCIVGCNAVVCRGKVPSYSVLVGAPAKIVKVFDDQAKMWKKV
ncbi:DapH/DapD/GlmU-related protein [Lacrimispora sp.]|uniref:acyltransferase n=1 Tax=Lacrimispora sp. TaxID=2719234 RepID=UPI00346123B5